MERNEIELLLLDYVSGNLSEKENAQVDKWIAESAENRQFAEQIARLEQVSSRLHTLNSVDVDSALRQSHRKINTHRRKTFFKGISRVAAILAVPLLVTSALLAMKCFAPSDNPQIEIRTTTGMTSCATLPDGSQVWLNSNSKLIYPVKFSRGARNVTLEGEGFFKVNKQQGRKFIVSAGDTQVEVLGTEFDVQAYPEKGNDVRTTLVSGKVKMSYLDAGGVQTSVEMKPGECLSYNGEKKTVTRLDVDASLASAWKEGKIVLNNTPLSEALRMIENRYNVEFLIKDDKVLDNRFTGTFTNQRLEVVLEHFRRTSDISFDMGAVPMDSESVSGRQIIIVKSK